MCPEYYKLQSFTTNSINCILVHKYDKNRNKQLDMYTK